MAILAMLVLFESFAIPHLAADMHLVPPWELVEQIGGLSFHSAVFFGALLLVIAIPMPYVLRSLLVLGAGTTMLVFGLGHMRMAVGEFAFRGHPMMALVFGGDAPLLALLLGGLLFPAALYWRSRYTDSFGSRITVLLGMLVVLAVYFFGLAAAGHDGPPAVVSLARAALSNELLLADRISAGLALVPLAMLVPAFLVFLRHPRTGGAAFWAWVAVTAIASIPLVQALMVAGYKQGQWKYVLAPLKASLFLYAGLLVAPVALGHLIGEIGRLLRLRRS